MITKEIIGMVLAKVPEDRKEAFLEEIRDPKVRKNPEMLEKYGVTLTAEEMKQITDNLITDEDLDEASGGCNMPCATFDYEFRCL